MYFITGPIWDLVTLQGTVMTFLKSAVIPYFWGYNRVTYDPELDSLVYVYELTERAATTYV